MTRLAPPPGFALLTLLLAAACTDAGEFGSDDTGGTDSGPPPVDTLLDDTAEDSDSEDTGEEEEEIPEVINPGTLTGMIYFDLYTTDSAGAVVPLDWAEWYGDTFPFGTVVVTGYTVDDEGETTYWSTNVLPDPSPDGEGYELEFGFDAEHEVYIQASLDYWGDGLIAPYDPSALYGAAVPVAPDGALSGVNITIDVPYYDFSLTGGYWNPDDWIQVSGDADVSEQLADGTCMAMVYDTTGYGPYGYTGFAPTATSAGAEGSYLMWAPKGMGDSQILGACDTNLNGMIEAADSWGGYSEDGDNVATVSIGTENLSDYTLTIPLNAPTRASVTYSGRVRLDDLTMEQVTSTTSLYITAQKYRVSESWDPDASGRTYDYVVYSGSEITDSSSYSLTMPADAVTWLWACLDINGNGVVNEAGEPCGQPSTDGKIATGSSSRTDLEFWIHTMQ